MFDGEITANLTLQSSETRFICDSLHLLFETLKTVSIMNRNGTSVRDYDYAKYVVQNLDPIQFNSILVGVTITINRTIANVLIHAMYAYMQSIFGIADSDTYHELEDIHKSIYAQLQKGFELDDMEK